MTARPGSGLLAKLRRGILRQGRQVPIYIFCHHKVATVLMIKVFEAVCARNHWRMRVLLGHQAEVPADADVVIFGHSLVDIDRIGRPFRGVHFIRDPRDVIVSGYLYHRRTDEKWCVNENFELTSPILSPQVPYVLEHRPESWKRHYVESLGGRSYQRNLLDMDQDQGLLFEMRHYASWTIERMREWDYRQPRVLELKFEDLMAGYDPVMRRLFQHLEMSPPQIEAALSVAAEHDLGRKSQAEISGMNHVSSASTTRWPQYFQPMHKAEFHALFGDVLIELGYETSRDW